jgi:hypothetical protein
MATFLRGDEAVTASVARIFNHNVTTTQPQGRPAWSITGKDALAVQRGLAQGQTALAGEPT